MAGGKQLDLMQLGSDIFVKSVTWSPDGKFLAYGNVPESDALVVIQTDTN